MRIVKTRLWTGGNSFIFYPCSVYSQSTGILDANGVEIYERDIVEWFNSNWLVKFDVNKACFGIEATCLRDSNEKIFHSFENVIAKNSPIKIVGNIFFNPDFLKK